MLTRNASAPGSAGGAQDLLVAAPQFSPLFLGGAASGMPVGAGAGPAQDSGHETGALFVYRGGAAAFPAGDHCDAQASAAWWAQGPAEYGRLGSSWALADWDGDGSAELVVGAPRAAVQVPPQARAAARAAAPVRVSDGDAEYAGAVLVFATGA